MLNQFSVMGGVRGAACNAWEGAMSLLFYALEIGVSRVTMARVFNYIYISKPSCSLYGKVSIIALGSGPFQYIMNAMSEIL